jgi:transposase-like protein
MRGRKPFGTEYVDKLQGPQEAKRRLKALLDVSNGSLRVCEACDLLGISPQRWHDLRQEFMEEALASLVGGKAGRPRTRTAEADKIRALEEENQRLRMEIEGLRVQAEVNLIVPQRRPAAEPLKKKRRAGSGLGGARDEQHDEDRLRTTCAVFEC